MTDGSSWSKYQQSPLGLVLEFSVGTQEFSKEDISIMKVSLCFLVKILEVVKDILKTQFIWSSTKSEIANKWNL